ncbi:RNA polymerase sigma factor [Dechloromonas denitrificans]|uniref:RNA polymerase sigma factor n=1 Tax=Dechloromonas denitrificans TaxID=281362 RepID=UPI001CFA1000|nr:sigma-70 family RNA polymerase sigma factor [Dechloromonas denitrificans]UCV07848.1 sigma-70 family RNA polymerase sigma factor [Dechloromonas denitrificans]
MAGMVDEAESGLIARAQAGDQRAFTALVRHYQDRLFRFILRLTGNRDEALDLTQESFLKAHQALARWRPEASFRSWLFRIAHNTTLDLLRRRGCIEFISFAECPGGEAEPAFPDAAPQPDQRLADRQSVELLGRTLQQLPVEQREILLLRELEEMSYSEIAATLGIAEGTVKSRLARARSAAIAGYQGLSGELRDD